MTNMLIMTPYEEEMLERLKKKCLLVWEKYKDNPGDYYQEKYDRIMACHHPDDAEYLIGMFDIFNIVELYTKLDEDEKEYYDYIFEPYFKYMKEDPFCNLFAM